MSGSGGQDPGPLWAALLIGIPAILIGLFWPVAVGTGAALVVARCWDAPDAQRVIAVLLTVVLYALEGAWAGWAESDRCKQRKERRARSAKCPVCLGWSGSVVLTDAAPAAMCDRHRGTALRITRLESSELDEDDRPWRPAPAG